jgi:hypothetical protein
LTFLLSAVLDNLTTAIVMMTVVRKLLRDDGDRRLFGGVVVAGGGDLDDVAVVVPRARVGAVQIAETGETERRRPNASAAGRRSQSAMA